MLSLLSSSLNQAVQKLLGRTVTDVTLREYLRDIQRALIKADVDVNLVLNLTESIKKSAFNPPPGVTRKDHILYLTYKELVKLLGEKPVHPTLKRDSTVFLLVGIQGSGKTTTVAKLANFYKNKNYKVGVVCADTYRPAAYEQLKQLLKNIDIPVWWEKGKSSIELASSGVKKLKEEGFNIILIDTAGRHRDESTLMSEMKLIHDSVNPDNTILVVDGTIGQEARRQAEAFHQQAPLGYIIVTKLDGAARGGGAISAVAATGAPIIFIGTGEALGDLEEFDPTRFVSRLLGYGDLKSLVERVSRIEESVSEEKIRAMMQGRLTLEDLVTQMESLTKLGPLSSILSMLPGGFKVRQSIDTEEIENKVRKWKAILNSMTPKERSEPSIINSSRVRRIARGAGVEERDVRDLLKNYYRMRSLIKRIRGRRDFRKLLRGMSGT